MYTKYLINFILIFLINLTNASITDFVNKLPTTTLANRKCSFHTDETRSFCILGVVDSNDSSKSYIIVKNDKIIEQRKNDPFSPGGFAGRVIVSKKRVYEPFYWYNQLFSSPSNDKNSPQCPENFTYDGDNCYDVDHIDSNKYAYSFINDDLVVSLKQTVTNSGRKCSFSTDDTRSFCILGVENNRLKVKTYKIAEDATIYKPFNWGGILYVTPNPNPSNDKPQCPSNFAFDGANCASVDGINLKSHFVFDNENGALDVASVCDNGLTYNPDLNLCYIRDQTGSVRNPTKLSTGYQNDGNFFYFKVDTSAGNTFGNRDCNTLVGGTQQYVTVPGQGDQDIRCPIPAEVFPESGNGGNRKIILKDNKFYITPLTDYVNTLQCRVTTNSIPTTKNNTATTTIHFTNVSLRSLDVTCMPGGQFYKGLPRGTKVDCTNSSLAIISRKGQPICSTLLNNVDQRIKATDGDYTADRIDAYSQGKKHKGSPDTQYLHIIDPFMVYSQGKKHKGSPDAALSEIDADKSLNALSPNGIYILDPVDAIQKSVSFVMSGDIFAGIGKWESCSKAYSTPCVAFSS